MKNPTLLFLLLLGLAACDSTTGSAGADEKVSKNKDVVKRLLEEVYNKGDMSVLDQIVAQDVKQPYMPESDQGMQGYKHKVETIRQAFPDLHVTVDEIIGEGDWVAVSSTKTGTHKGAFMDVAPTDKSITEHSTGMVKVVDGKITELRGGFDMESIRQQLQPEGSQTPVMQKEKINAKGQVRKKKVVK